MQEEKSWKTGTKLKKITSQPIHIHNFKCQLHFHFVDLFVKMLQIVV